MIKKGRFVPAHFFHPEAVSLSGASTPLGAKVLAHLRASPFGGALAVDEDMPNADMALVADEDVPAALARHAAQGARAAVVLSNTTELGKDRPRVLGPYSYGVVLPGLNASVFGAVPPRGKLALVGQSASLARLVIDWAVPNNVGFSHIVGIGGNADLGFGTVLDYLARDPGTGAILIEIDRLRDPRAFLAAARVAARLRPVVAIAPGIMLREWAGSSRAVLEAAFARAGVLLTGTIGEFLAAAETLTLVKPAKGERLAIVSNSVLAGRLAADAALEAGIGLAPLGEQTAQVMALSLGFTPPPGPIDVGEAPTRLAEVAAMLSSAPEVGGILVVHAPSGGDDEAGIEALVACAKTVKIPLLIAAMGETAGAAHRHRLTGAGLACFEAPEAAIAGFRHLLRNRRNRAAARELPDSRVLEVAPDKARVRALLRKDMLVQNEALAVLAAYQVKVIDSRHVSTPEEAGIAAEALGFPAVVKLSHADVPTHTLAGSIVLDLPDADAVRAAARAIAARLAQLGAYEGAGFVVQRQARPGVLLRIRVSDHPILGPVMGFGAGGGDPEDVSALAWELPPLNLALAHGLVRRSALRGALASHRGAAAADEAAIAAMLVQVSQLVVDTPEMLLLDVDPIFATAEGAVAASARVVLRPAGQNRPPLIISPYPSEWTSHFERSGQRFLIRPIRPEDADGYAAMFGRFTRDDMRYRFFSAVKALPAEQITRMTDVDYGREMAFIAVNEASGEPAGGARLVRSDTDGREAEFAVGVEPAAKGLGLASALMRQMIAWGKAQGVAEITGTILADNAPMLGFIKKLGFVVERVPGEADIVEAKLVL